ncbi:Glycosyltransferase, GT2 family [Flavobacterium resistens]|uniref:Glycosyltransferase n=1 Tax=Flavobacterium resistens TaxID=443612 RepID=A0A521DTI3_9FLAO|nr:glycosyltransferase [Flavobacterium resistens]MRX68170.1 glycosyltransferase [Flavobacterium resistens]SMO75073.1 Glycosyltransferase, GT2 family [Flavobacterium resistens]
MLKYSIIICSYNRFELLVETIDSVLSVLQNRQDSEILIIDNKSTDLTSSLKTKYSFDKTVKYFLETKQGLSHARNRGMEEASGEILVYLDDDVELKSDYFEVLDSILIDDSISAVGGKVLPFNVSIPSWLPEKYFYLVSVFSPSEQPQIVKYLMGANFIVRKSIAEKIGGFDVRLGRNGNKLAGGEEIDFLNRIHSINSIVFYSPKLIVYHKINDKLNINYVLTYSKELGKSERIIDTTISTGKVRTKKMKSVLAVVLHFFLIKVLKNEKKKVHLKIMNEYGKGYLE